jgi:phospholipid/cholesterol/gamma-HCH transport system substrate-binding protein
METRANHVLIGSFALLVIAAGMLFALWIGKSSLDREFAEYDVIFKEAVTGLSKGGTVQYNGIQVGEVRRLSLAPNDPSQVIVHIRLGAATPVKTDTHAKLAFTGLTGVAIIQLSGGTPAAPKLEVQPGQEFPTIIADTSELARILASSGEIVTSVNDLLLRLSVLLKDDNLKRVSDSLDHIEQISGAIALKSDDAGRAVADLAEASRSLKNTLARGEALAAKLEGMSGSVQVLLDNEGKQALGNARDALAAANKLVEHVDGTLAANRAAIDNFADNGLAQIGPTLVELRATLAKLEKVADRLEQEPSSLVHGRETPRSYKPR